MPKTLAAAVVAAAALASPAHAAASPQTTVIGLLNQERAAHGAGPLHADARLSKAARGHSRDMVAHHTFGHGSFVSRIERTGWMRGRRGWKVGENLAWGEGDRATPQAIVNAWMASPPHRATLLNPAYHHVGVGIAAGVPSGASDGATYTADFGS
jgi:uncharacterized protein YkwD